MLQHFHCLPSALGILAFKRIFYVFQYLHKRNQLILNLHRLATGAYSYIINAFFTFGTSEIHIVPDNHNRYCLNRNSSETQVDDIDDKYRKKGALASGDIRRITIEAGSCIIKKQELLSNYKANKFFFIISPGKKKTIFFPRKEFIV